MNCLTALKQKLKERVGEIQRRVNDPYHRMDSRVEEQEDARIETFEIIIGAIEEIEAPK